MPKLPSFKWGSRRWLAPDCQHSLTRFAIRFCSSLRVNHSEKAVRIPVSLPLVKVEKSMNKRRPRKDLNCPDCKAPSGYGACSA